jgi:membrane protease YdiL (CAAX protease family)
LELKRRIDLELWLVFGLSLGKSAIYSVLAFVSALTAPRGLGGSSTTINESVDPRQWLDFSYQFAGIMFQFVPVALTLFLVGRGALAKFGIIGTNLGKQLTIGFGIAAGIGIPGLALYLAARALGLSAKVIATDVNPYWWTTPLLLLSAVAASVLEEMIMIGYVFHRLRERGMSDNKIVWLSSLIRGSYHLYQGVGGFVGNVVMGLLFGYLYKRTGKLIPLLFAHFLIDAVVFVGYAWASKWLPLN